MYEKTVDDVQLNECLAKENYLEATQMLIGELKTNCEKNPDIPMLKGIYASVTDVANRDGMAAKSIYDLVSCMRGVLLLKC